MSEALALKTRDPEFVPKNSDKKLGVVARLESQP